MSAPEQRKADALQFIFSLFLGILLVVVIGVGVWTFYPDPFGANSPEQERLEELYKEQESVSIASGKTPTGDTEREMRRIQDQIDEINDSMTERRDIWAVNTSIILLSFATVLMAVSLFLPETMRVFSNGVLLGGLFTMIYGTGWSFAGGQTRARFFVVLVALVLSVVFGYLRFIRARHDGAEPVGSAGAGVTGASTSGGAAPVAVVGETGKSAAAAQDDATALAALTARVDALEARAAAAAAALKGAESD